MKQTKNKGNKECPWYTYHHTSKQMDQDYKTLKKKRIHRNRSNYQFDSKLFTKTKSFKYEGWTKMLIKQRKLTVKNGNW